MPSCFPPFLKMLVRLKKSLCGTQGLSYLGGQEEQVENSVLAGMLASVDAHNYEFTWSTCAQCEIGIAGLEACWGCLVSTEPVEPQPGTWLAQTHSVCLPEESTCEICVLVGFLCALCLPFSSFSHAHLAKCGVTLGPARLV